MSKPPSEHDSEEESLSGDSEYLSEQEQKLKKEEYVTITHEFLHILFPLPAFFPKVHKQFWNRSRPPYIHLINFKDTKNALVYIN